jgi:hypothetical protein
MAVVPDKMCTIKEHMSLVESNQQKIIKELSEAVLLNSTPNFEIASADNLNASEAANEPDVETISPLDLSIIKNSNESIDSNINQRQLRSCVASQTNMLGGSAKRSQRKSDEYFELIFILNTSDQIEELLQNSKYFEDVASDASVKLRTSLCKLVDKFDALELCKAFKIDSLSYVGSSNQKETLTELANASPKMISVRKLVEFGDLKLLEVKLKSESESDEAKLNEEVEKRKKYRVSFFFFAHRNTFMN